MILPIITTQETKKNTLKSDIKISNVNNTIIEFYQKMLTKFFDLTLNFSIDNTKLVIKGQAEFLCIK